MKLHIIIILFSLLGFLSTPALCEDTPDYDAIRAKFAAAINNHDIDAIVSLFTEDGVSDATIFPSPLTTPEQMKMMWADQFSASPDLHGDEGLVLTKDNFVIVNHALLGTNTRDADNKPWIWPHIDVFEFEGNKIKHLMSYGDYASIMVQLGFVPAPEIPDFTPSVVIPDPEPTGLSPLEANAEMVRRWNNHDPADAAKMVNNDALAFVGPLGQSLTRTEVAAMNEMYFAGFSDTTIHPKRTIDLGNGWVLFEHVVIATHDGTYMGVPASGYPVEVRAAWLTRYDSNGLVAEMYIHYNNLTVMEQMTTAPQYSPVGQWVVTVPTPQGTVTLLHTVSPNDRPGGEYVGVMQQINSNVTNFDIFPDQTGSSHWIMLNAWKGRNTIKSTALAYGTKFTDGPIDKTSTIIVMNSEWVLTGPNTNEGSATQAVYLAEQDVDGDGFPDAGQEPVALLGFNFTSKRLTMTPPSGVPNLP